MPSIITRKQVAAFLKPRPKDSHKGLFGTVTVIGGANGMVGAALLAGRAALKMGAGCVHVGLLADHAPLVDMEQLELMLHSAGDALNLARHSGGGRNPAITNTPQSGQAPLSREISNLLDSGLRRNDAALGNVLVIGCGLGQSQPAQKLLYDALLLDIPLVLDADALNIIAQRPDLRAMLHGRKAPAVFTPHPGEAAHLLGCKTEDIQRDREAAARQLTKRLGGSVVLKGAGSLCATSDGKLHLNQTGNPGMSSAGMGDVLAGMIAAFIAQGLNADQALLLAVHLHGAAGDELAKQQATLGMSATEVMEWARWLLNRIAPELRP
ncbi:MAG: NAD(P)H-hydrate dehydratase [Gammaproteobacteria bacterium]|nr:NAD(P)H-hydrate dehydratase [Gammaproteobacteria bacterium]MBU1967617.1 NAD(P)H-hydrate dehydratase [Gammaproteobacteria bacterium]